MIDAYTKSVIIPNKISKYHSCFISYSTRDKEFVEKLYGDLTSQGIDCWLDDRNLITGNNIGRMIENEIKNRDKFVLILSKNSMSSGRVPNEVYAALEKKRKLNKEYPNKFEIILPIKLGINIDDIDRESTPWAAEIVRDTYAEDFSEWKNKIFYARAFKNFLTPLKLIMNLIRVTRLIKFLKLMNYNMENNNNDNFNNIVEIVGFDLGHGETSATWLSLLSNAEPKPLRINQKSNLPTAIGKHPKHGILIGHNALKFSEVENLKVGFKKRPPGDKDYSETLKNFMIEYNRLFEVEKYIKSGKSTYYFVGCPSGWKEEEIDIYEHMLKSEYVPNVKVVSESRAALLQVREVGKITNEQLKNSVLVIDVGSLTTDATLVYGGLHDQLLDLGIELGASIIEQQMLQRAIEANPDKNLIKTFFENANTYSEKLKCEYECRLVKERYWQNEIENNESGGSEFSFITIARKYQIKIELSSQDMEEIINSPLPELNGKSWINSFQELLLTTRAELKKRNKLPRAVVLTGSASQMSFIGRLCEECFPEADIIRYPSPEETVAAGLARWGKIYLNDTAFSEEVKKICENNLPEIITRYKNDLINPIINELVEGLITNVIEPTLRKWKDGTIKTLKQMDSLMIDESTSWIKSEDAKRKIENIVIDSIRPIVSEVNDLTMTICQKYGIPYTSLRLEGSIYSSDEEIFVSEINKPFDTVLGIAGVITFTLIFIMTGVLKTIAGTGTGPFGWVFLTLIGLWGGLASLPKLDEILKEADIPNIFRIPFLTEEKIKKTIIALRPKLEEKIRDTLDQKQISEITQRISDQIRDSLNEKANEIKWIIS